MMDRINRARESFDMGTLLGCEEVTRNTIAEINDEILTMGKSPKLVSELDMHETVLFEILSAKIKVGEAL